MKPTTILIKPSNPSRVEAITDKAVQQFPRQWIAVNEAVISGLRVAFRPEDLPRLQELGLSIAFNVLKRLQVDGQLVRQ